MSKNFLRGKNTGKFQQFVFSSQWETNDCSFSCLYTGNPWLAILGKYKQNLHPTQKISAEIEQRKRTFLT